MLAPATEVEPVSEDWTAFRRTERVVRPRRTVKEIQIHGGDVLREYSGGTVTASAWVPAMMRVLMLETLPTTLNKDYRAVDFIAQSKHGIVVSEIKIGNVQHVGVDVERDSAIPLPESALIAREVRDLSGLGAQRLGEIFPVERESYQRWVSGKTQPSPANLERLLALRHFLRELANRVPNPKNWILAPLAEGTSGTRYEALKAGKLSALWDAIAVLPSGAERYTRKAPDGSILTVTDGSLRGRDIRTSPEELEDYEDWLGEDE